MNQDRWQRLDQLFHAALDQPRENRASYLSTACGDDQSLRQELDAMLEHHDQANSFIESPAYMLEADTLIECFSPQELVGRNVGQYRIIQLIGMGGMGVVYLAYDEKLRRNVVLKFLTKDVASDPYRLERFNQEATAASALNHPNILTIHEIGEIEGHHFIAFEFVEGRTLRQMIRENRLSISEVLDIATQIATALAAAHAANLIHRDIKPENIMVRPDGLVKVLDFGLAKLIEPGPDEDRECSWEEAGAPAKTEPGLLVGTIRYMSPEQLRGESLDGRSDLWSLGVVVYEMMAQRPPFDGVTHADLIVAILKQHPSPLGRRQPEELQTLVKKLLQKNRDQRYQTANELISDLQTLRSQLAENDAVMQARLPRRPFFPRHRGAATAKTLQIRQTSSAEYIVSEIRKHKIGAAIASLTILVAVVGLGLYFGKLRRVAPAQVSRTPTVTKITTSGKVKDVAVSPDGKYIVYVLEEKGGGSFWLRQVGTTSDIQIAAPGDFGRLTISPDNTHIFYKNFFNTLYEFPILGGPRKLVLEHVYSPVSFSPDGKQFAFVRFTAPGEGSLMIANSDGSNEQTLITRKQPERFLNDGPAWSPDGRTIACVIEGADTKGGYAELVSVDVNNHHEESIISQRTFWIGKLLWLPDKSGIIVLAN